MAEPLRLSVGPAPSNWGAERLRLFYREMARSPVDSVYLGETACPDRSCLSPHLVDSICDELARAGKKAYASSLALVRDDEEYRAFEDLARRVGRVEINSPAFLDLARGYPAVGGIFLNVYNSAAAGVLARNKVARIVLPCELRLESIAAIEAQSGVATEVVVHGYIPIAVSHACATARCVERDGRGCGKVCRRYPEGITLNAGERSMFRIEGPQTLSAATFCLVEYLSELQAASVDTLRIIPQLNHTARIVRIYRDVMDRRRGPRDALNELKSLASAGLCNGWFLGKAGWIYESPN